MIADQVFEHLPWPMRAGRNVYKMLRPGGYFIIATPFLVRVHDVPIDCCRWTKQGLSYLLQECGFREQDIKLDAWGNRKCLKANLFKWRRYGWYRSLANEPNFPIMGMGNRSEEGRRIGNSLRSNKWDGAHFSFLRCSAHSGLLPFISLI
nr:hypothetical protein [Bradyrhizobium valentinum]